MLVFVRGSSHLDQSASHLLTGHVMKTRDWIRRLVLVPIVAAGCCLLWPAYWLIMGSARGVNELAKEVLLDVWEGVK